MTKTKFVVPDVILFATGKLHKTYLKSCLHGLPGNIPQVIESGQVYSVVGGGADRILVLGITVYMKLRKYVFIFAQVHAFLCVF